MSLNHLLADPSGIEPSLSLVEEGGRVPFSESTEAPDFAEALPHLPEDPIKEIFERPWRDQQERIEEERSLQREFARENLRLALLNWQSYAVEQGIDLSHTPDPEQKRREILVDAYVEIENDGQPIRGGDLNRRLARDLVAIRNFDGRGYGDTNAFFFSIEDEAKNEALNYRKVPPVFLGEPPQPFDAKRNTDIPASRNSAQVSGHPGERALKYFAGLDKLDQAFSPPQIEKLNASANLTPDPDDYKRYAVIYQFLRDLGAEVTPENYQLYLEYTGRTMFGIPDDVEVTNEVYFNHAKTLASMLDPGALAGVFDFSAPDPIRSEKMEKLREVTFKMISDMDRVKPGVLKMVSDFDGTTFPRWLEKSADVAGNALNRFGAGAQYIFTLGNFGHQIAESGHFDEGFLSNNLVEYREHLSQNLQTHSWLKWDSEDYENNILRLKLVDKIVEHFKINGITDGAQMSAILHDAAKQFTWAKGNHHPIRVLSDGRIVMSPIMAVDRDPSPTYNAIQSSSASPAEKELATRELWMYRKAFAEGILNHLLAEEEEFAAYFQEKKNAGVTDVSEIVYSWNGLTRGVIDRNWGTAADAGAMARRSLANTVRSVTAGAEGLLAKGAEAVGADGIKGALDDNSAWLMRGNEFNLEQNQKDASLAALRGEHGPIRTMVKEIGSDTLQALPIFLTGPAGRLVSTGAKAGSIRLGLSKMVPGTLVYGWAGAQGYGATMDTALQVAKQRAEREKRPFTDADRVKAVEDAQGAAMANAMKGMLLAKVFNQGVQRVGLGTASQVGAKMTLREGLEQLAQRTGDTTFKSAIRELVPEMREMLKVAGHDIKDDFIENILNDAFSALIEKSTIDPNKDMGQAVSESFANSIRSTFTATTLPSIQSLYKRSGHISHIESDPGNAVADATVPRNGDSSTVDVIGHADTPATNTQPGSAQSNADARLRAAKVDENLIARAVEEAEQRGNIANTDDIRSLIDGYDEANPLTRDAQSHEVSSAANKEVIKRLLAKEVETGNAIILAGGPGSGKSTALERVKAERDLVIDTVSSSDSSSTRMIADIKASGRNALIIYVHRPFDLAFEGVIQRYLNGRDAGQPRLVPMPVVAQAHIGAQETALNRAADGAAVIVFDNSGKLEDLRERDVDFLKQNRYINQYGTEQTSPASASNESGDHRVGPQSDGGSDPVVQGRSRTSAEAGLVEAGNALLERYRAEGKLTDEEVQAFKGELSPTPDGTPDGPSQSKDSSGNSPTQANGEVSFSLDTPSGNRPLANGDPAASSGTKDHTLSAQSILTSTKESGGLVPQDALVAFGKDRTVQKFLRSEKPATREQVIEESIQLEQWAEANNRWVAPKSIKDLIAKADRIDDGSEHNVLIFDNDNGGKFVLKLTHDGKFGMENRTPSSYLGRWALFNAAIPEAAARFVGYTKDAQGRGVIIMAQPYILGTKRDQAAITKGMAAKGFELVDPNGTTYRNPETGVEIHDAHNDNVLFTKDGTMIPIDVWIADPRDHYKLR
jgi:hypothetical protein